MAASPGFLFHGTNCKNVQSICDKGILRGTRASCSKYSKICGFSDDCTGNVSLAVDKQDARFFCVANKEDYRKPEPQCIIKVRTDKLDPELLMFRELFGKESHEVKYYDDIPVEAIENIQVRSHERQANGVYKWVTKVRKCPVGEF